LFRFHVRFLPFSYGFTCLTVLSRSSGHLHHFWVLTVHVSLRSAGLPAFCMVRFLHVLLHYCLDPQFTTWFYAAVHLVRFAPLDLLRFTTGSFNLHCWSGLPAPPPAVSFVHVHFPVLRFSAHLPAYFHHYCHHLHTYGCTLCVSRFTTCPAPVWITSRFHAVHFDLFSFTFVLVCRFSPGFCCSFRSFGFLPFFRSLPFVFVLRYYTYVSLFVLRSRFVSGFSFTFYVPARLFYGFLFYWISTVLHFSLMPLPGSFLRYSSHLHTTSATAWFSAFRSHLLSCTAPLPLHTTPTFWFTHCTFPLPITAGFYWFYKFSLVLVSFYFLLWFGFVWVRFCTTFCTFVRFVALLMHSRSGFL